MELTKRRIRQLLARTIGGPGRCAYSGKVQYRAEKDAKAVLEASPHGERRAYLCPSCFCWHLTSQPKRKRTS